jgi:hypothetical protein
MRRASWVPLVLAGALLLSAASAAATTGVSIDVGSIAIREELSPGGEYRLPTFGVRNPGTEETSYVMLVSYLDGQETLQPPKAWFTFSPATLTLAAGNSAPVSTRLEVPPDAEPGDYAALIGPQIASEGDGAQVGAGAVARLTFTVQPSSWFDAWLRWLWRFLSEHPWVWIAAVLIGLLGASWFLRRRFSFTVARRS